jgi:hypothetical protein
LRVDKLAADVPLASTTLSVHLMVSQPFVRCGRLDAQGGFSMPDDVQELPDPIEDEDAQSTDDHLEEDIADDVDIDEDDDSPGLGIATTANPD